MNYRQNKIVDACSGWTRYLGYVKRIAAWVFFAAIVAISQIPASASVQSSWRMFGRGANILLHEKRYPEAIDAYQKAIDALPSSEKREDARLDLLMAQAEAYRLWGHFDQCSGLLDDVKRDLKKGEAYDPTIGARYWRRRGDLMFSLGRREEMLEALKQQLDVTQKFFDPTSEHFLSVCEGMAYKLLIAEKIDELAEVMRDVCGRLPKDAKFQREIGKRYRFLFDNLVVRARNLVLLKRKAEAHSLLVNIQQIDPLKSGLGDGWLGFVGACAMQGDTSFLSNDTAEKIIELSRFYKQNPTVDNLHQEVSCHVTLEYIYGHLKQFKLNDIQKLAMINAIEKLLPNNATSFEKQLIIEHYTNLTADEMVDNNSPAGLKMLRMLVMLTPVPPVMQLDTEHHKKSYSFSHVAGRLRLARLCSRLGMMDEAEKSLGSISKESYADKGFPFAQTHIMLAEGYVDADNIEQCKRHLQIAEQMGLGSDYIVRANRIKARLAKIEKATQ